MPQMIASQGRQSRRSDSLLGAIDRRSNAAGYEYERFAGPNQQFLMAELRVRRFADEGRVGSNDRTFASANEQGANTACQCQLDLATVRLDQGIGQPRVLVAGRGIAKRVVDSRQQLAR